MKKTKVFTLAEGADARRIINGLSSFINVITLKRADAVLPHGISKAIRYCGTKALRENAENMSFRGADARQIVGSTVGIHFISGKPITNNASEMDCDASLRSARNDMKCKCAFTLAEVLITLMVIGVVAVLTIPAMITNINDKILEKQQDVFSKKFTEGLRQMRVDGMLNQKYETTEAFVNAMGKYFKIATICKNDNLKACFNENFTYDNDVEYNITLGKDANGKPDSVGSGAEHVQKQFTLGTASGSAIKVTNSKSLNEKAKYETDVMGIVFADGVQMLLYVNPDCEGPSEGDTESSVTSCIGYLADVNQAKSPNRIEKDIVSNIFFANLDFEMTFVGLSGGQITKTSSYAEAKNYCENLTDDGGGWRLPDNDSILKLAKSIGYFDDNICSTREDTTSLFYRHECNEDIINQKLMQIFNGVSFSAGAFRGFTESNENWSFSSTYFAYTNSPSTSISRYGATVLCIR